MHQGHDQKGTVMRRSILTVLVILLTLTMPVSAGIRNGFHEKPYVMYSDKNHPLSDTAVFSTIAHPGGIVASRWGQIISVDGKKTSCRKVGCPVWVRVLPAEHKIKVRLSGYDYGLGSYYRCRTQSKIKSFLVRATCFRTDFVVFKKL